MSNFWASMALVGRTFTASASAPPSTTRAATSTLWMIASTSAVPPDQAEQRQRRLLSQGYDIARGGNGRIAGA